MATIEDVAAKAGVSVTTVSRALNNHPYVSEQTKKKIFDAMDEMNFTPNSIAQSLRGKKNKMIGVVVSRVTNPFFAYLVDAIEQVAFSKGYQVVILQTMEDSKREMNFLKMIDGKQLDGVIMTNTENSYRKLKKYLDSGKLVVCNRYVHNDKMPVLRIDEEKSTYDAVMYLFSEGYRKIAYFTGPRIYKNDLRYRGYVRAHEEQGIPVDERLLFYNVLSIEDGRRWTQNFKNLEMKPDAVFTNGDEVAASIIGQSYEENIRIPGDLAVMGFDDQPLASLVYPKLTTIHQPIKEMGTYAAEILFSKLLDTPLECEYNLDTTLVIRATT